MIRTTPSHPWHGIRDENHKMLSYVFFPDFISWTFSQLSLFESFSLMKLRATWEIHLLVSDVMLYFKRALRCAVQYRGHLIITAFSYAWLRTVDKCLSEGRHRRTQTAPRCQLIWLATEPGCAGISVFCGHQAELCQYEHVWKTTSQRGHFSGPCLPFSSNQAAFFTPGLGGYLQYILGASPWRWLYFPWMC